MDGAINVNLGTFLPTEPVVLCTAAKITGTFASEREFTLCCLSCLASVLSADLVQCVRVHACSGGPQVRHARRQRAVG